MFFSNTSNPMQRPFDPFSNQSEADFVFDSRLHWKNSWIEGFFNILNQRIILLLYNINTDKCTHLFITTKLHLWINFKCLISNLESLHLQRIRSRNGWQENLTKQIKKTLSTFSLSGLSLRTQNHVFFRKYPTFGCSVCHGFCYTVLHIWHNWRSGP